MTERTFTLENWEYRKYHTRDGRDAKIVHTNFKSKAKLITLIGTITNNDGSEMIGTWKNNGAWELEESKEGHDFDLFDVPDQKEHEHGYLNLYKLQGGRIIPLDTIYSTLQEAQRVGETQEKFSGLVYSGRIKVYLIEGRWDS